MLAAQKLIGIAEDAGLMIEVGEWVLTSALTMAANWREQSLPHGQLHINVCSRELGHPGFLDRLSRAIDTSGLAANAVTVEVSERNLERHREQVIGVLTELRTVGVRTALDDFGSGELSLLSLQGVPLDELKVDCTVASRLRSSGLAVEFFRSTVRTAHSLGLTVVAEGVERNRDLTLLTDLGCDQTQGRRVCPPLSAPELLRRLGAERLLA